MTRDERLLKQALDVLDWAHDVFGLEKDGIAIKTALRDRLAQPKQDQQSTHSEDCWRWHHECAVAKIERLAQPEQEPVSGVVLDEHGSAALVNNGAEEWHCKNRNARRLYTAPPQRTWAGSGDIEDSNAYLAAEREKVVAWMTQRSYATGHGDTIEDLLKELEWQVAEREREACAKLCEEDGLLWGQRYAAAIRARGQA